MHGSEIGRPSDLSSNPAENPLAVESTEVILAPLHVLRWLFGVMLSLLTANVVVQVARYEFDLGSVFGLWRIFDLNQEANIPTFFSGFMLLFAALLLLAIGRRRLLERRSFAGHWIIIAMIFLFLAVDEMSMLHELAGAAVGRLSDTGDLPNGFRWTIPYVLLILVGAVWSLRFYLHLNKIHRLLFGLAGVLFIGGAVGMEVAAGYYLLNYGESRTLEYALIYSVEEIMEMSGIIIFITALLHVLAHERVRVVLGFASRRGERPRQRISTPVSESRETQVRKGTVASVARTPSRGEHTR